MMCTFFIDRDDSFLGGCSGGGRRLGLGGCLEAKHLTTLEVALLLDDG